MLLDRLPKSFITSPPMIAAGGVFVLLYGLVMIPVVSAIKNRPEPEPPPPLASRADRPGRSRSPKGAPDTDKPATGQRTRRANPGPVERSDRTREGREPKENPAPGRTTRRSRPPRLRRPGGDGDEHAEARRADPDRRAEARDLGDAPGFPGDCKFVLDAQGADDQRSPALSTSSTPTRGLTTPPGCLTEAGGDFTAQVQVVGKISPATSRSTSRSGAKPKEKDEPPKFPFTFQGAGLLLSQDTKNYLRLERRPSS